MRNSTGPRRRRRWRRSGKLSPGESWYGAADRSFARLPPTIFGMNISNVIKFAHVNFLTDPIDEDNCTAWEQRYGGGSKLLNTGRGSGVVMSDASQSHHLSPTRPRRRGSP